MRIRPLAIPLLSRDGGRHGLHLFFLGALVLFVGQVCLRWFPEQVRQLGPYPNVVLLACLLGTAAGCLAAGRSLHQRPAGGRRLASLPPRNVVSVRPTA